MRIWDDKCSEGWKIAREAKDHYEAVNPKICCHIANQGEKWFVWRTLAPLDEPPLFVWTPKDA